MYVSWYGFGRMFIEGLRTDSLYVGVFRISQVLGFFCFLVGASLLIYNLARVRRQKLTSSVDYTPEYPKFKTSASMSTSDIGENEENSEAEVEDSTEPENTEE